jgi:hypothetical protein
MGQLISDVTDILNYQDSKKQAKNTRQEILAEMARDDAQRTNLVKKVLATQRAKYGASGMSGDGVTEGAVLRRLRDETNAPYADKRRQNMTRLKQTQAQRPNLLKTLLSRFDQLLG